MGSSIGADDDRISLVIDTQSNLAGLKQARTETQAYANEVKAIGPVAAAADQLVGLSTAQQSAAWAQAGGSVAEFNAITGQMIAEQESAAAAARATSGVIVSSAEASASAEQAAAAATTAAADSQSAALVMVGNAAERSAAQQEFGSRAAVSAGRNYEAISPKARSAANAFAILTQVAVTGQGSMAGMASAAGIAGQSIAAMATSARVAALASGIGALITVAAVAYQVLQHLAEGAKATQAELEHIGNINIHGIDAALAQARKTADAAMADYIAKSHDNVLDFLPWTDAGKARAAWQQASDFADKLFQKSVALKAQEAESARARDVSFRQQYANTVQSLVLEDRLIVTRAHGLSDLEGEAMLKRQQILSDAQAAERQIQQQYTIRDAEQQLIPLTGEQIRQRNNLLQLTKEHAQLQIDELNRETELTQLQANNAAFARIQQADADARDNVRAQYEARLTAIQDEEDASIRAGESRANAEREAQLKIRALRKQTTADAMANYAAITNALVNSNNRGLRAVGSFGETIRKVLVGADGAHSAVLAIKEAAAAIGAAAVGDFRGAALHGASALEYGKAAALAATESLGSSSGGGGGGSSSGSGSTFEPSDRNAGSGNQVLVLNTVDPYSGAAINSVAYELQRSGQLNKPIFIPPTAGFAAAGG